MPPAVSLGGPSDLPINGVFAMGLLLVVKQDRVFLSHLLAFV
jgi:hypothetical protein